MTLLSLIVILVVLALALYLVRLLPLDSTLSLIIQALLVVAVLIWIVQRMRWLR